VHVGHLDSHVLIQSNEQVGAVTFNEGVTVADPIQCRRYAEKCVRFAQRARSDREKRALLKLARTWSSLATQTEAYEAIVCKLGDLAPDDEHHVVTDP
jgi:hypothetical protein